MSNLVDENPQALISDSSSPTRVAASPSDIELMERSQAFLEVMKQVDSVANTNLPVLLNGEPGTGKQLVACAIHQRSPRSDQPFVAANCSTLSAEDIETEVSSAGGGTLFLDEITGTDSSFQEKLLEAMQAGKNVRVIAASSRNVEEEVAAGRFREDLFHAIGALSIVLPAQRTFQFTERDQHTQAPSFEPPIEHQQWVTLSEIEGQYVARVLQHTGGNKQAAARLLSVDRKTLDRMIKRHHILYPQARHRAKASVTS